MNRIFVVKMSGVNIGRQKMTEKRYYQQRYEEEYYIFDSEKISEKEFEEKMEIEGYKAFEDSLTGEEVVKLLNENEELKQTIVTICKDYEEAHGMDIRNAEWFTCW